MHKAYLSAVTATEEAYDIFSASSKETVGSSSEKFQSAWTRANEQTSEVLAEIIRLKIGTGLKAAES